MGFVKTLYFHPAGIEYLRLFRAREGKDGEKEEWQSYSVTGTNYPSYSRFPHTR